MLHVIYGLSDPSGPDPITRYVGYTGKSLSRRLSEHLYEARRRKCHRHHWLMSMTDRNIVPAIEILEIVSLATWQDRERWWIAALSENKLVNGTSGGEGLIDPTADVRERISKGVSAKLRGNSFRLGIPHTSESKSAISAGLLASSAKKTSDILRRGRAPYVASAETREKIRLAKLGKARPDMSEKLRGNEYGRNVRHTEEFKASVGERNRQSAGCKWITNGILCRRLMPNDAMPHGWRFGRR